MKTVEFQNKIFYEIPKGQGKYFICKETTEILSLMRSNFPRILKPTINGNGYYMVGFFTRPNRINVNVHRAMMETFVPNPHNYRDINHIDGNKLNNQLDNLEYCTSADNIKHSFDTGLHTKFTNKAVYQFSLEGKLVKKYDSLRKAATELGCDPANICTCLKGRSKHAMGYLWSYSDSIEPSNVQVFDGFIIKEEGKEDIVFTDEKEILKYLGIGRTTLYTHCKNGKPVKGTLYISRRYK